MRKTNVLPFTAFEHLPVEFSYNIDPKTRRVDLVISTSEEFAPMLMDGIQVLARIAEQSKRFVEMAQREKRSEDFRAEHKAKTKQIVAAYWNLRGNGLKQREAVHVLVADPATPYHGQWQFSDYARCVKAERRPAPTLRRIPKQPTHIPR